MKTDRDSIPIAPKCKPAQIPELPLPGEDAPALVHAMAMMEAYVSEQFDALVTRAQVPPSQIANILEAGGFSIADRGRDVLQRLTRLTPREADVLSGLADGKSSKSLAFDLRISQKTVEVHRSKIMSKLECGSLFELGRIWEAALFSTYLRMTSSVSSQMVT